MCYKTELISSFTPHETECVHLFPISITGTAIHRLAQGRNLEAGLAIGFVGHSAK